MDENEFHFRAFFVNFGVRALIWELLQSGNCNL